MSNDFRRASPDDVLAIETLVDAAYGVYIERIGRPPSPMLADYQAVVAKFETWVAIRDGELVGLLVLQPGESSLLIENIAVAPRHQGHKLGRTLLEHAETRARAHGVHEVWLYTNEAMTENLAWYGRRGYVEYDRHHDGGYGRVFLRKRI